MNVVSATPAVERTRAARGWLRTADSRFVERGAIRWHVQVTGSGPTILLVHGTGASSHSFRELMPLLSDVFTVVAPDLPGHALSSAPRWFEPSLPGTAAALAELVDALGLPPAVAVGHSAGAAVVARMTLDRTIAPRLVVGLGAALVPFRGLARAIFPSAARALATASKLVPFRVKREDTIDRLLQSTGSTLDARGIELYRRLSECPDHVTSVLSMMAHWDIDGLHEELPELGAPLLLVAGRRDRAVPVRDHRATAARVRGTKIVIVDDAGHLVHEEQPATVARLILKACSETPEPPAGGHVVYREMKGNDR